MKYPRACPIERLMASAYRIPTESPEADGTLEWDSTTLVTVHISSLGVHGLGYTFGDKATAVLDVEHFLDHARIEGMFFEGAVAVQDGLLRPDVAKHGFGLEFHEQEAKRYAC